MRGSDRRAGARVLDPSPVCLHLRSERQQDQHLSLRLDANRDAVEMKRRGSFYLLWRMIDLDVDIDEVKTETEGKIKQATGTAQDVYGKAKDAAGEAYGQA